MKSIAKMSTAHPHTFRIRRITKDVIDQVGAVMKSCNNDLGKCSSLLPGLSRQMIKSIYDKHFNDQICYPSAFYPDQIISQLPPKGEHLWHTTETTNRRTSHFPIR